MIFESLFKFFINYLSELPAFKGKLNLLQYIIIVYLETVFIDAFTYYSPV